MSAKNPTGDVVAILARYAPTPASVSAEWHTARRRDTLAAIVGTPDLAAAADSTAHDVPLHFVPARTGPRRRIRRVRAALPVVASGAVLALAASVLVSVVIFGRSDGQSAGGRTRGPAFVPPAGLSNTPLTARQYSYRVNRQLDLDANGKPIVGNRDAMVARNWISADGGIVDIRKGSQNGCSRRPPSSEPSLEEPTVAFFGSLPTDVDALTSYLRHHVRGSSSLDEAVFVAVGDALRIADGLATPRLRAAMVGVLSRTPGVRLHQNQRDYLNRRALRADFVDQKIRPGEINSLYFDPATFQLLEERTGHNSQPNTYNGPSPAYTAAPGAAADDPDQLTGAAYLNVMISEKVVDKLPKLPPDCK